MARPETRDGWHIKVVKPRLPWGSSYPRAAEVGEALGSVMLSREFALEDAQYQKIVPNEYVVELLEENYRQNYQPIEARVLQQWRILMLEQLATANSRQGRNTYQLGAPLHLAIHPVSDLKTNEVRILCRVQHTYTVSGDSPEPGKPAAQASRAATPCLEMLSSGQRWPLQGEILTIGRDERCNLHLNMPIIQDKRLVSGEHAYIRFEQGRYFLYDGSPDGKASLNGTFVNRKPVPLGGYALQDGDEIILASIDPGNPQPDAPGVVTLRFQEACA